MRIGDFDKLKQTIKDKYSYASATGFLLTMKNVLPQDVVYQILTLIDEAPSVDTTEQEENAYNEGYAHGLETKRTQGEWGKWVISEIRCPNCLGYFSTDCYSMEELKNCPVCGAE